jgi:septal ring factor EnvC (AmiA/AmiB activator)
MLRQELIENEKKVREKERTLAEKKREKEQVLAYARKEKSSHEKMLRELKEASKKLLEIIRESEKADAYSGKGFPGLKGRLPWPVEGKVALNYGFQRDPQFHTPLFRNGIFIQAGADLFAKAVHSGKIVFAEWFKGYGQLMIVNHGDGYHTLYGSLAEIFSKVGDIIKKGQVIGRVGNSGIMNEPGLYFELRYRGKPLDPLQWLVKR